MYLLLNRLSKTLIVFICILFSLSIANPNQKAWQFLVDNKPFEAQKEFRQNIVDNDKYIAGEAYRGLSYTAKFIGDYDSAMVFLFRSYICDQDSISFNAAWINVLSFGRQWYGSTVKDGYTVMKKVTSNPGIHFGKYSSILADRYVNDGKISKARKLIDKLGIVRNFKMIGPFDNISGSGYKKVYLPEIEIDFEKKYTGKNGAKIGWFNFSNTKTNGWVFTEYNYVSYNTTLYYYSNIHSDKDQSVNLSFGASGSFKVFINDNLVLADSVFRNTGTDMFIQKVHLFKGSNKLLIKLCHENRASNFLVRFMDDNGMGVVSLSNSNKHSIFQKDTLEYTNLTRSPQTEMVEKALLERQAENPNGNEATLLLMDFYNSSELTKKGQELARTMINKYPESSLWLGLYSESLRRSKKVTETQTVLNTAYRLCPYNFFAWQNQLSIISNSASSREVMDFILKSPKLFQDMPQTLFFKFSHYAKSNNETEAMKIISYLRMHYSHISMVVNMVASLSMSKGNAKDAEKLISNFLKKERTSTKVYSLLAEMYLKMGQKGKAIKTYEECLDYSPNSPGLYYYLAKLSLQHKEYETARSYIEKALSLSPTSSTMISLKGIILKEQGKKDAAIAAFEESIGYTYNDFDAWDHLLPLQGKPELSSLTKVPTPSKLLKKAQDWEDLSNENGAILSYTKDIFFYPSRCTRERHFVMVHLPTQNAIDTWKEYSIGFNSHYQVANITRAYSLSASGKETPADIGRAMVVFKTLQPKDAIVLEWTIDNYYNQDMAKQVWGKHEFSLPYPVFETELRFVTPVTDTIPYTIQGDSVIISRKEKDGFVVTTFSRKPYKNPPLESFALISPPEKAKVYYSTFSSWSDISNWYLRLTENKLDLTYELKTLVDSLIRGRTSPYEKVRVLHEYMSNAIRYSFVSFRQSGWMPQPAGEVLATKIGDCKDMSSLGKTLFDYAGIKSNLVLVNTSDRNSVFPSYIGPNFNHCILSYTIENKTSYIDMTDNNLSFDNLPRMDQGSLALIVKNNNKDLIHLPLDKSNKRIVKRTISSTVDNKGNLKRKVSTLKTGIFASAMRANYRFRSKEERIKDLHKVLVKSFSEISIDSLNLGKIDSLKDTLVYFYSYTAKKATQFSGNTALLSLNIPNKVTADSYPSEENRNYPIDMTHTWFGIGDFEISGELTVPDGWRLINKPEPVALKGYWGSYSLVLEMNGNKLTYTKKAIFDFSKPVKPEKSAELQDILAKIAQSDNIQLMFYVK